MKNTAIEKLSYTEVTKNISQAEYNQTQEEYILSKSPDKYMISLPVKVLMFEGAEGSSPFTYYFYMENDEDLYLMQRKRNGSVVDKTISFKPFLYKLLTGVEPVTSSLPMRCATSCATAAELIYNLS